MWGVGKMGPGDARKGHPGMLRAYGMISLWPCLCQ